MSVFGYQSDFIQEEANGNSREDIELIIRAQDISPIIEYTPNRNRYVLTQSNIILCKDIELKSVGGLGQIVGRVLSFPVPFFKGTSHVGTVFTQKGGFFSYRMDDNGHISLSGRIDTLSEEIYFNMAPYVAEFPLRYVAVDYTNGGGNFIP